MRPKAVRALCALGVTLFAVLPSTVGAASPQVEVRAGRACGAAPYCLTPSTLTVPVGSTVLWHNLTGAPLLISRCSTATCPGTGPGTGPDTGPTSIPLGVGSESGQTYEQPGTYHYAFVAGALAVLSGAISVTPVGSGTRLARTVAAPAPPVAAAPPAAAVVAPPPAPATAAGPLVPTLVHPATAAAPPLPAGTVAPPVTGADPPWLVGGLLAAAGSGLLALGRQRPRRG